VSTYFPFFQVQTGAIGASYQ